MYAVANGVPLTEEQTNGTAKRPNKSKRKPKGTINFDITLNEEQKQAKKIIIENDIIVLFGKAGSGKCLAKETLIDIEVTEEFYDYLVQNKLI